MTSIVGAGNREGKFERRLQSALGCDELKQLLKEDGGLKNGYINLVLIQNLFTGSSFT